MWKGERVDGPTFYALLYGDDELRRAWTRRPCCWQAGNLAQNTSVKMPNSYLTRATLGRLITIAEIRLLSKMLPA